MKGLLKTGKTLWSQPATRRGLAGAAWLLADAVALLLLVVYGVWAALPHFCDDITDELQRDVASRRYVDRQGRLMFIEQVKQDEIRQDVPLQEVDPLLRQVMLTVEDQEFYEHDGVNRRSVLRAMLQNLTHGRVISGASTITMQLVSRVVGRRRSYGRKLRQAGCARRLEWHHGKDWILQEYLNKIPFGGRMHGIEAASQHYLGHSARHVSLAEASFLCGLPQRPSAYRPERYEARARGRQRTVLQLMERAGMVSSEQRRRILADGEPRLRDFRFPSVLRGTCEAGNHYVRLAGQEAPKAGVLVCAQRAEVQELLELALKRQVETLQGVRDGAGIVIDNATGEVLALCGTLDFHDPQAGQVNAATSLRSAGSTLKPFIFAEAIDGGLICPDTILHDNPLRFGNYAPGNYDGTYSGGVRASEALSRSLNTPAVRLVARLGAGRMLARFDELGLLHGVGPVEDAFLAEKLGLSMTLGTAGHRLLDLAGAYAMLARGGQKVKLTFLASATGEAVSGAQLVTPGAAALVTSMLSGRALPDCTLNVAWKTGTSTGNRDAWCFAYTSEITVGVWFGNKDGSGSPALVGAEAAAPCAAAIFNALYRDRLPRPFQLQQHVVDVQVCRATGLRATPGSCETMLSKMARNVPLNRCQKCRLQTGTARRVKILRPLPETYSCRAGGEVRLAVAADMPNVHWYLDGTYCGQLQPNARLSFGPGTHTLRAVSEEEDVRSSSITFTVQRRARR